MYYQYFTQQWRNKHSLLPKYECLHPSILYCTGYILSYVYDGGCSFSPLTEEVAIQADCFLELDHQSTLFN